MKAKIGMSPDASLSRQARTSAAGKGKALADHLKRKSAGARGGIAPRTAGSLKLSRRRVDRILREEPELHDGQR